MPQSQAPHNKKVTYAVIVYNYRPLKDEKFRVNKLLYHVNVRSPAADLLEIKMLLNSAIYDAKRGARCMCLHIKDYFLETPMQHPEFIRVKLKHTLPGVRCCYNIDEIATKDELGLH